MSKFLVRVSASYLLTKLAHPVHADLKKVEENDFNKLYYLLSDNN